MSLPSRDEVKARLRIENDVENDDIDLMIASATSFIEEYTGRPIYSTERTWVLEFPGPDWARQSTNRIFLPLYPMLEEDSSGPLTTITDADGVDVDVANFRVNAQKGMITAINGTRFGTWPYTVTATVGLEFMDDFATRVEPNLSQALMDLIADWYQRRSPGAFTEGAGGGVMTQWMGTGTGGMESVGTPARALDNLKMYRLIKAV